VNDSDLDLVLLGVNFENESKILQKIQSNKFFVRSILPPSEFPATCIFCTL
jgi:hypothetical protein